MVGCLDTRLLLHSCNIMLYNNGDVEGCLHLDQLVVLLVFLILHNSCQWAATDLRANLWPKHMLACPQMMTAINANYLFRVHECYLQLEPLTGMMKIWCYRYAVGFRLQAPSLTGHM